MVPATPLSEADLHGLVDGRIEASRRADVLRRVAASPSDRARIEAWQDQNALIRSAFLGLDKEPLPAPLKLLSSPTLRVVTGPEARPAESRQDVDQTKPPSRRTRAPASAVTLLMIAGGLGASWMLLQPTKNEPPVADLRLRGPVEAILADQAAGAIDADRLPPASASSGIGFGALPTSEIPDLTPAGFVFTSAEARAAAPQALVFHYRDGQSNRIAISAAKTPVASPDAPPTRIGRSFSWHRGDTAFAIAGTVRPDRLRAMAELLQSGDE